jgi:uncharacterized protein Usg
MKLFEQMTMNYRLTTAEILYHMPDHPSFLQTFVWQELDINPDFPRLMGFLNFWERALDGKLHSVKVMNCGIIHPGELRYATREFYVH